MNGQEGVIPNADIRLTEIPEEQNQELEAKELDIVSLAHHPGWDVVRTAFQEQINAYKYPELPSEMDDADLAKEYRFSKTIAGKLQEVLDNVQRVVDRA